MNTCDFRNRFPAHTQYAELVVSHPFDVHLRGLKYSALTGFAHIYQQAVRSKDVARHPRSRQQQLPRRCVDQNE